MEDSKKLAEKLEKKYELVWDKYTDEDMKQCFELSDRYIDFLSNCKTERECVNEFKKQAIANGYKDIEELKANGVA